MCILMRNEVPNFIKKHTLCRRYKISRLAVLMRSNLLAAPLWGRSASPSPIENKSTAFVGLAGLNPSQILNIKFAATAALMISLVSAAEVKANDWSTSGDFKLSVRKPLQIEWGLPTEQWKKQHFFEKSVRGYEFKLAKLPSRYEGKTRRDQLLSLIASVEAPHRQYDAVHYKAKVKPPALPSTLTIGQILRWIEDTPGQYHAIGRYQIIPDTLAYLIEAESISHGAVFDKKLQDQLAIRLLVDAGLGKFEAGTLSIEQFMDRVAGVWAGLPLQNDKSAYDGIAGNRAIINRSQYKAAMSAIYG